MNNVTTASEASPRPHLATITYAAPMAIIFAYLGFTIWLFLSGPINWPLKDFSPISLFLAIQLLVLLIAYGLAIVGPARSDAKLPWKPLFVAGAVSSCLIVFPSIYFYTGKMPWQIIEALRDQNAAYLNLQAQLLDSDGGRGPIVIARALSYPFVFGAVPLGILHWEKLGIALRTLFIAAILSNVVFSVFRGTDRETFDVLIVVGASISIRLARAILQTKSLPKYLQSYRFGAAIIAAATIVILAVGLFIDRKAARYEGDISGVCVGVEMICADKNHPLMRELDIRNQFGFAMLTAYLSQGYYGLALALNLDFKSTLGAGHSPLAARIYELLSGDLETYRRSYTFRLGDYGWSDKYHWPTFITWIANDIGFTGAVLFGGFIAFVWGLTWKDAVFGANDAAAVMFCLLMQLFVYFPANNQLLQTLDGYFAVVSWFSVWIFRRLYWNITR